MKTQSNIKPETFDINPLSNGMAEVMFCENTFCENTIEAEDETSVMYFFDMYCMVVPNRETLAADIEANYDMWLARAKKLESAPPIPTGQERLAALEKDIMLNGNAVEELILLQLGGM